MQNFLLLLFNYIKNNIHDFCSEITCDDAEITNTANVDVTFSNSLTILGTIVTYSCAEGYTGDTQYRTCVHNGDEATTYGTWTTETIPTCTSKIDISYIRILNEFIYI